MKASLSPMSSSLSKRVQEMQHKNSTDSGEENGHYRKVGMNVFRPFSTKNRGRVCTARKKQNPEKIISETGLTWPLCRRHNLTSGRDYGLSDPISASVQVTWQIFVQAILSYGERWRVVRHTSHLLEAAVAPAYSYAKTQKKVRRLSKRRGQRGVGNAANLLCLSFLA